MSLTFSMVLDEAEGLAGLDRLTGALGDMTGFMDSVGSALVSGARERISTTSEAPDGSPWPASFRVREEGGKTLWQSGRLLDSVTARPAADHVLVGSNMIYAAVHQFGAVIRAKTAAGLSFGLADGSRHVVSQVTIPARPYIGVSEEDRLTLLDLAAVHFGAVIEGLQP